MYTIHDNKAMEIKKTIGQVISKSRLTQTRKGEPHFTIRLKYKNPYVPNMYHIATVQIRNKLARTNYSLITKGMTLELTGWIEITKDEQSGREYTNFKANWIGIPDDKDRVG